MAEARVERRLAAILAADIAGSAASWAMTRKTPFYAAALIQMSVMALSMIEIF
jgi:hypothetical protein